MTHSSNDNKAPRDERGASVAQGVDAGDGVAFAEGQQGKEKSDQQVQRSDDSSRQNQEGQKAADSVNAVGGSAALMSVCVLLSRITGFLRTWAMAFALGATMLSSSYQVANTLPNMLYEMVVGGMLVTAFLPVYVSVKKRLGNEAGNEYASNLFTIVVILLGFLTLLCMAFPQVVVYTQSFLSDQGEMGQSVFFFQFFAIQIVFYGMGAILSGLLNANRDYLWSSIAPVANNLVVITTFVAYAIVAPHAPEMALYIIAIGNPAGVIVQALMQWPALKRHGIRLRFRLDLRDPALKETVAIGVPAVLVMLCSFAVVSVQNAASYAFSDAGPSIIAYSRLWFTLPYAFLVVPITTAMFTELADMQAEGNIEGVKRGVVSGTNQILFFMIPFAMYLAVFSFPLVSLYHIGAFSMDSVGVIARFLAVFAIALPFYGVFTYAQKVCSSLRIMHLFAVFNVVAGLLQMVVTLVAAANPQVFPIEVIALAEGLFYLVAAACVYVYLHKKYGGLHMGSTVRAVGSGLLFGGLGAGAGAVVLWLLGAFVTPLNGSVLQAFVYIVLGGCTSLVFTFGPAIKLKVPEAQFVSGIVGKVAGRLARR